MEFVIDFDTVRRILNEEGAQARMQLSARPTAENAQAALNVSLSRMDRRLAEAPDAHSLACKSGCDWCCHFTIDVRPLEALNIAEHVLTQFTPDQRQRVRAEIDANAQRLATLDEMQRVQQNLRCPFLIEHRCSIYAVRPQTCRNYHATNVAGCEQSFNEPDNVDIDPEFAPLVYQIGVAHVEAFTDACAEAGHDTRAYELNGALAATLADIEGTRLRFTRKQRVFPQLEGHEVEMEFID